MSFGVMACPFTETDIALEYGSIALLGSPAVQQARHRL